jgi:hypothetical protein
MPTDSGPLLPTHALRRAIDAGGPLASVWLSLAWLLVSVAVGMAIPEVVSIDVLEEAGPIEVSTIYLYLAVAVFVALAAGPSLTPLDRGALAIVLLGLAAREADLHLAMYGVSILKSAFYFRHATGPQILGALAVLLPIVVSAAWLAKRHAWRWRLPPSRWQAPAVTLATFMVVIVLTKVLDRLPDTLLALGTPSVPVRLRTIFFAIEEILEMSLPLLVALAVVQDRAASPQPSPAPPRHRPAPSAPPASRGAAGSRPRRPASGPRRVRRR